jgi:RNA polymerase sigma factor for flagellar operon FliA
MNPARSISPAANDQTAQASSKAITSAEIARHLPLVRSVAARFRARLPPNVEYDDLLAAGTYGLIDALRKNPELEGQAFEWYARVRIQGAIIDDLRTQDWLSRRARKQATAQAKDGSAPLRGIVAMEDLSEAARQGMRDESLPSPLEAAERRDERKQLSMALEGLAARDRLIMDLHYSQGMQFKDIAARLGVSESRVSQLHTRTVSQLRRRLVGTVAA